MLQPVKEKIILGIDPGTTIMGYGVLRIVGTKPELVAMGIIDLRKFDNHYLKLRHIQERVLSEVDDEEYVSALRPLLKQKQRSTKAASDYELRQKLIRFALSRGFGFDIIRQCIDVEDEDEFLD